MILTEKLLYISHNLIFHCLRSLQLLLPSWRDLSFILTKTHSIITLNENLIKSGHLFLKILWRDFHHSTMNEKNQPLLVPQNVPGKFNFRANKKAQVYYTWANHKCIVCQGKLMFFLHWLWHVHTWMYFIQKK